jgi:hypothetical protein
MRLVLFLVMLPLCAQAQEAGGAITPPSGGVTTPPGSSPEQVQTTDGRLLELKEDGTYRVLGQVATLPDGSSVILKDDHTWLDMSDVIAPALPEDPR